MQRKLAIQTRFGNQESQTTSLPSTDPTGPGGSNWETEEELDVEWAHALAPGARIVLVEADSQSLADLMSAVATAANQPGVSVVSMSWGFPEGQGVLAQDEAEYDQDLTTPAGHTGVTFVASTGDYGAADPEYPALSPNVVAVGGTTLALNPDNSYAGESGWGEYNNSMGVFIGSGGGVSQYEAEPVFQAGVQSTGYRTIPDVSFDADPSTGVWIADPYNLPDSNPWETVGGTSVSAPAWASVIALANQGRAAAGEGTLGSSSDPTATQEALYSIPASDYNAITSGYNGYSATAGYNLVTGLGTPIVNQLVPDLITNTVAPRSQYTVTVTPETQPGNVASGNQDVANVMNVFDAMTSSNARSGLYDLLGRSTPPAVDTHEASSPSASGMPTFILPEPDDLLQSGVRGNLAIPGSWLSDCTIALANFTLSAADDGTYTFINKFELKTRGTQTIAAPLTSNSSLATTDDIDVT